eukprot:TRINITY_DN81467_c0_g1_i1.p1 TRINITY_DN81467_c0_g1~~TRINITY_DN81467_c0_g1_i1.p1  ORF type:complete len:105 (+),score=1.54 TRINITY_DN81467_c0_g1_i1:371-685(+)
MAVDIPHITREPRLQPTAERECPVITLPSESFRAVHPRAPYYPGWRHGFMRTRPENDSSTYSPKITSLAFSMSNVFAASFGGHLTFRRRREPSASGCVRLGRQA